jgi:glucose-6-phosphate 1-epimerase
MASGASTLYIHTWIHLTQKMTVTHSEDDRLTLTKDSASAVVHLFGATLLDWTPANSTGLLFTSSKALTNGSKAIRGGIPLVFPQFGPGPLPQHGFARVSRLGHVPVPVILCLALI